MNYIELYRKFETLKDRGQLPDNVKFDIFTFDHLTAVWVDGKTYYSNGYTFSFDYTLEGKPVFFIFDNKKQLVETVILKKPVMFNKELSASAEKSINFHKAFREHRGHIFEATKGKRYEVVRNCYPVYSIGAITNVHDLCFGVMKIAPYRFGADDDSNLYIDGVLYAKPVDTEKEKALERIKVIEEELKKLKEFVK